MIKIYALKGTIPEEKWAHGTTGWIDKTMEEYMERPRGVKMINTADGHRLCTSHQRKGLYG